MIDKGPKMIDGDFKTQSLVTNVLKDSRLMLEQGQKFGSPMLMTNIWSQLMQASEEAGYGRKMSQALLKSFEVWRDLKVG